MATQFLATISNNEARVTKGCGSSATERTAIKCILLGAGPAPARLSCISWWPSRGSWRASAWASCWCAPGPATAAPSRLAATDLYYILARVPAAPRTRQTIYYFVYTMWFLILLLEKYLPLCLIKKMAIIIIYIDIYFRTQKGFESNC